MDRFTSNGKEIRLGIDGQLWTWTSRGQLEVAESGDPAKEYVLKHMKPSHDRERLLWVLALRHGDTFARFRARSIDGVQFSE